LFIPPVGYYWPGYKILDRELRTPVYGPAEKWDGHLQRTAKHIK